jgi:holo-[acyl-carrier protein] synthase
MIGVDVVDLQRFRLAIERTPRLTTRLFTEGERAYCEGARDPVIHLAGTFAAKEALIKALSLGPPLAWMRQIEIVRAPDGAPSWRLLDGSARSGTGISISHDGPIAVAMVVAL